jgi:hypothetical protein
MPRTPSQAILLRRSPFGEPGEDYYRDLIQYTFDSHFLIPIGFCLRNTSSVAAINVVAQSRIAKLEGVRIHDQSGEPYRPSKYRFGVLSGVRPLSEQLRNDPDPDVSDFPTHWELTIPFGRVLPKATVWSTDVIFIGSAHSTVLTLPFELYAENVPDPQTLELSVSIEPGVRPMTRGDLPSDDDE